MRRPLVQAVLVLATCAACSATLPVDDLVVASEAGQDAAGAPRPPTSDAAAGGSFDGPREAAPEALLEASVADESCSQDLTSDPNNCGACGHACGDGQCFDGRCGSWPVTTAGNVAELAADESYLAWSDGSGGLFETRIGGGSVDRSGASVLVTTQAGPVLANGVLAWLSGSSISLAAEGAPGAGAAQAALAQATTPGNLGISADAATSYYLAPDSAGDVTLFGCDLTGPGAACAPLETIGIAATETPAALVVTSRLVFSLLDTATPSSDGAPPLPPSSRVICYDIAAQASNPYFQTGTGFGPMASDDAYLYWSSGAAPNVSVNRIAVDGGPVQTVAANVADPVVALATDGYGVYFSTSGGTAATLWSAPTSGATPPVRLYATTEASGSIPAIVIAKGTVYFADVAAGTPPRSKILAIVP